MEHPAARPRIIVEGTELLRPFGTGLATQARMVVQALARLGCAPDVLVARDVRLRGTEVSRALAFFGNGTAPTPRAARLRAGLALAADLLRPAPLVRVPMGPVQAGPRAPDLPQATGWLASPALFGRAHQHLRLTGRPLSVRLPDGAAALVLTSVMPLLAANAPTIVLAADLIPLTHPQLVLDPTQRFLRSALAVLPRAAHVVTCTQDSRAALVRHLGLDPTRISVASLPVEARAVAPLQPALDRFELEDDGFLLFAGAVEPKKNLPRLIDAYAASGVQAPLVLAGPDGWLVEQQLARIGQPLAGKARIIRLGWLPAHDLAALMATCRCFVFPSVTEGFGLPALEAMAAGAAVIAGNRDGLAEIVGDAALTVDPDRTLEIAAAIARLDSDAELRRALRRQGRRRAALFTPARFDAGIAAALGAIGVTTASRALRPAPAIAAPS